MTARIMDGKLYKIRYALGDRVQPAVVVGGAQSMDEADQAVLLHAAEQPGYGGEPVRILASTAIDTDAL